MRLVQSHGRLLLIMVIISIPVGLGFGSGIWISQKTQVDRKDQESQSRFKQISVQATLLSDLIAEEVEALRMQSLALFQSHSTPTGKVLHLAEVEFTSPTTTEVKYIAKNPLWNGNAAIEENYLKTALKSIDIQKLNKNGSLALRIKKDPHGSSEWLSFAFSSSRSERAVLLVLVDPLLAFPSFQKWVTHSSGGKSRSYLLSDDGRVLIHSQKEWAFADFSRLSLFENFVRKALQGTMSSGQGDFQSIDRLPVTAAFVRLGHFPFAVVVEEVNTGKLEKTDGLWIAFLTCMAVLVLFAVVLGCSLFLGRYLVKTVTLTVHPTLGSEGYPGADDIFLNEEGTGVNSGFNTSFEGDKTSRQRGPFFTKDEMLILNTTQSSQSDQ